MCGIVGYIGNSENANEKLIEMLKKLEYRGYDSAGVATIVDNEIVITKEAGAIYNVEQKLKSVQNSNIGIAHTRWATHGIASQENAHPFLSNDNTWALVHNGIIENYSELKDNYFKKHFEFKSMTDSEVVVQLLGQEKSKDNMFNLISVCKKINGSYAFACLNKYDKDTIYLAKNKSPLYLANNNGEVIIASDPICFDKNIKGYYSLDDFEFCKVCKKQIRFYDINYKEIVKKTIKNTLTYDYDLNNNYSYYMIKEINEEIQVIKKILTTYTSDYPFKQFDKNFLKRFNDIVFIGCGTAYHAGLYGAEIFRLTNRIRTNCYIASEYRYSSPIIDEKTLVVLVSQSGETADTLAVNELAKSKGATTIALTNVLYSTLAKNTDYVLPVCAGPEIAVASTKAYVAQLVVLYIWAMYNHNQNFSNKIDYLKDIKNLQEIFEKYVYKDIDKISKLISNLNECYFIGRNFDYITAIEGSLKLKEITYINCEAYPSGELKHGHLALVDNSSYMFVVATDKEMLEKTLNGASEAKARGAKIIVLSNLIVNKKDFYRVVKIPNANKYLMPIISIRWLQMLAYEVCLLKGYNPDKPRNLAKSVTVE